MSRETMADEIRAVALEDRRLALQLWSEWAEGMLRDAARLQEALREALDGWAYAAQYKGEYFRGKHGDDADIARLSALLDEPPT